MGDESLCERFLMLSHSFGRAQAPYRAGVQGRELFTQAGQPGLGSLPLVLAVSCSIERHAESSSLQTSKWSQEPKTAVAPVRVLFTNGVIGSLMASPVMVRSFISFSVAVNLRHVISLANPFGSEFNQSYPLSFFVSFFFFEGS